MSSREVLIFPSIAIGFRLSRRFSSFRSASALPAEPVATFPSTDRRSSVPRALPLKLNCSPRANFPRSILLSGEKAPMNLPRPSLLKDRLSTSTDMSIALTSGSPVRVPSADPDTPLPFSVNSIRFIPRAVTVPSTSAWRIWKHGSLLCSSEGAKYASVLKSRRESSIVPVM